MHDDEVLGHLLEIEAEAAALVDDAQAEADRRIMEAEKQNRSAYEARYREESKRLDTVLQKTRESAQQRYQEEIEAYKEKNALIDADIDRFSALLNSFIEGEK